MGANSKKPNPAFSHVDVPLVSTFVLSSKVGKEVYVEPIIDGDTYRFEVRMGKPTESAKGGTTAGKRSAFICLMSGSPIDYNYIRAEGTAGRMSVKLMAIVAEGSKGRIYLSPSNEQLSIALQAQPMWSPEMELPNNPRDFKTPNYGLTQFGDSFTPRQLVALTTFSDLVQEARAKAKADALSKGMVDDGLGLDAGGKGASAYADAVGVYLGLAINKLSDRGSSICGWDNTRDSIRNTFGRQAIPMVWDFAESNPMSDSSGSWVNSTDQTVKAILTIPVIGYGEAIQFDAQTQAISQNN